MTTNMIFPLDGTNNIIVEELHFIDKVNLMH